MSNYFEITLRPVENYFFGGERTFGEGESVNYSAQSNQFPQQTALLGLLRYVILEQSSSLPLFKHRNKADELIGSKGFNASTPSQSFGMIRSISPLLLKNEQGYFRIGDEKEVLDVEFSGSDQYMILGNINKVPTIKDYDPKKRYETQIIALKNKKNRLSISKVLIEETQVGIKKAKDGETHTDSFFRHKCYRLKDGFRFSFVAEIEEVEYKATKYDLKKCKSIINFGAEQKQFHMEIKKLDSKTSNDRETLIDGQGSHNASFDRIILISDAIIDFNLHELCEFYISETTNFRTMSFDYNYSGGKPLKLNLLQKGGILYPKEGKMNELSKCLKKHVKFRNIGFNHLLKAEKL